MLESFHKSQKINSKQYFLTSQFFSLINPTLIFKTCYMNLLDTFRAFL